MPTATSKGHLDQERKNLQSTQPIPPPIPISAPTHPNAGLKTMNAMVSLFPVNRFQKAFSDLTGRFPHKSSRGHRLVSLRFEYYFCRNCKNRQAVTLTKAWEKINALLKSRGEQPLLYILDNEVSQDLRRAFSKTKLHSSWSHHIYIEEMRQNERLEHSKNIFLQGSYRATLGFL